MEGKKGESQGSANLESAHKGRSAGAECHQSEPMNQQRSVEG